LFNLTASDHGVDLVHGNGDRTLRRSKIDHLIGSTVGNRWRGCRQRALDGAAGENVNLVAFAGFKNRDIDFILPFGAP